MRTTGTFAEKRCEAAIQTLLELISLFEAEAMWDLVEASRATVELLREGDFSGAWRLCFATDAGNHPQPVGRTRDRLLERWTMLEYLLCSLAELSEEPAEPVHD